ncbi:MAG: sel1 repeat family protein [Planctomycetes bacterium]|nr:sel1 repeat family protein [Planctomycetota bacterium]
MQAQAATSPTKRELERAFQAADRLLRARRPASWKQGKARMAEVARADHVPALEAMVEVELEERALVRAERWAWRAFELGKYLPLVEVAWDWVFGKDGWSRSLPNAATTHGRDPRRGRRLLERAARRGDVGAIYWLTQLLDGPSPLGRHPRAAHAWRRRGAALGDPDCLTDLGVRAFRGDGVERDVGRAVQFYRRAARLGGAEAAHNLGLCSLHGDGVPRDARVAKRWMKRAEELGNVSGTLQLARFHFEGVGGPRDARKGLACLRRAQKTTWRADRELARRKLWGDGLRRDVRAGLALLRARERVGDAKAMRLHADWLHDERRDYGEAARLYRRAATSGDVDAMLALHDCLAAGHGLAVRRNDRSALRWLGRAIELEADGAWYRMGERLVRGQGVVRDVRRGMRLVQRSIDREEHDARLVLGELLLERARSRTDLRRALATLLEARARGVEDVERPIRECRQRLRRGL